MLRSSCPTGIVELSDAPVATDTGAAILCPRTAVTALNDTVRLHGNEKVRTSSPLSSGSRLPLPTFLLHFASSVLTHSPSIRRISLLPASPRPSPRSPSRSPPPQVALLKELIRGRAQLNSLQWTKEKLALEHQDAVDLTAELQILRVTRNLQDLIKAGGHDSQHAAEHRKYDRKMAFLKAATGEKLLGKKEVVDKLRSQLRQRKKENDRLEVTVQHLQTSVKERLQVRKRAMRAQDVRPGKQSLFVLTVVAISSPYSSHSLLPPLNVRSPPRRSRRCTRRTRLPPPPRSRP